MNGVERTAAGVSELLQLAPLPTARDAALSAGVGRAFVHPNRQIHIRRYEPCCVRFTRQGRVDFWERLGLDVFDRWPGQLGPFAHRSEDPEAS